jgi:hypothetical protein
MLWLKAESRYTTVTKPKALYHCHKADSPYATVIVSGVRRMPNGVERSHVSRMHQRPERFFDHGIGTLRAS